MIEACARELPAEPAPAWLHLRVPEYGIYDDAGAFSADVMQPTALTTRAKLKGMRSER